MEYNNSNNFGSNKIKLNQETKYDCEGQCTCKFLKDRSNYDIMISNNKYEKNGKLTLPIYNNNNYNKNNTKGWL